MESEKWVREGRPPGCDRPVRLRRPVGRNSLLPVGCASTGESAEDRLSLSCTVVASGRRRIAACNSALKAAVDVPPLAIPSSGQF
jgi:hypothetical protein